jgi:hypothetical protein
MFYLVIKEHIRKNLEIFNNPIYCDDSHCLYGQVVRRQSCKLKIPSSNLGGGYLYFAFINSKIYRKFKVYYTSQKVYLKLVNI